MKIIIAKPPIWDEANKLFRLKELGLGVIFTYGDTIYNPFNIPVTRDLVAHEEKHAEQQQHDETCAGLWWKRYVEDPAFRIEQEAQAYRAQFKCICKTVKDRNNRARNLHMLASQLSGPIYGNSVTHTAALQMIGSGVTLEPDQARKEVPNALQ